jgi:hypothetical protein
MNYTFRPAVRENVGLFIGLAGGTGSGKTWSAMTMAKGIVGPGNRFAVIDTENRRASHYAEFFDFDVLDLAPPFSSDRYGEAVQFAVDSGYKCIVVDSVSHEHDGIGGYLDTQAADLAERVERMMKKKPELKEWDAIDRATPLSWNGAKKLRKRMRQIMLDCSTSIPIIFCFRAEEKVFASKDGKLVAHNPPIWAPVCGKEMPFEMTAFFMLHRDNPGVPKPIKLEGQHESLFPLNRKLDEACGKRIADWARGRKESTPQGPTTPAAESPRRDGAPAPHSPAGGPSELITPVQVADLEALADEHQVSVEKLREKVGVQALAQIRATDYGRACAWIKTVAAARGAQQ